MVTPNPLPNPLLTIPPAEPALVNPASAQTACQVVPFHRRRGEMAKDQGRPSILGTLAAVKETPAPLFTWEALERQLIALAVTPTQRALVPTLVSATRKQSQVLSAEQVLRELLCIASVMMDETFHPDLGGETP